MKYFSGTGAMMGRALLVLMLWAGVATTTQAQFAKGADVSWLTQMEETGTKWYTAAGVQQDVFTLLKAKGVNAIRLRVWTGSPWHGFNAKADVVAKAKRAQSAGMRIMIDFHYSDTWADPAQQTKPAAWSTYTVPQLVSAVSAHTTDILNALKANGITPEWVQVGNETNDGMLWPEGRLSTGNFANFAQFVNAGYNATKAVFPSAKVVIHLSNGFDNVMYRWLFDGLKNNGGKWDVVGMSLYPTKANWSTLNSQCLTNMKDMVSRYGKQVVVSEVGMEANTPTDCKSFLSDLMTRIYSLPNGSGLGVFYWEPESYNRTPDGYTKGAFDSKGRITVALDAYAAAPFLTVADTPSELQADNPQQLSITPNPGRNIITILLPSFAEPGAQLTVASATGAIVYANKVAGKTHELQVSAWSTGTYIVHVQRDSMKATARFLHE